MLAPTAWTKLWELLLAAKGIADFFSQTNENENNCQTQTPTEDLKQMLNLHNQTKRKRVETLDTAELSFVKRLRISQNES